MQEIIIDASNATLGRLASYTAKQALQGKKIIIVSHIYDKSFNEKIIKMSSKFGRIENLEGRMYKRYELVNLLENLCKKNNITFFNPSNFIDFNEVHKYLTDANHYTKLGYDIISKQIYKLIIQN